MKNNIKYVSILTIMLALIGVTIFGTSADAAGGVKTTYGRRLQEQSPESLDSSYAGWSWVDSDTDYFGTVGNQTFVITKDTQYQNLTINVQPRTIAPIIKTGSSTSTVPTAWAGNTNKAVAHTVTVSSNNTSYGTVSQSSSTGIYKEGTQYTITATPKTNYKFVKWNDGNTSASRNITMSSSNKSYTATFESSYIETAAGRIDPSGITHLTGAEITSRFPENRSGYQYIIWAGSYSASNLPTTYSITTYREWTRVNQESGLMGRLAGADAAISNGNFSEVMWLDASDIMHNIHSMNGCKRAVYDSTFTIAPIA